MKKKKFRLANFTLFAIFVDLCVIAALVVINNAEFKAFWIPTAMTTMSHKYLAYTLYDVDTVNKIMSENYIEQNTRFGTKYLLKFIINVEKNLYLMYYKHVEN